MLTRLKTCDVEGVLDGEFAVQLQRFRWVSTYS